MRFLRRIARLLWRPVGDDDPVHGCTCDECQEMRVENALKRGGTR